MIHLKSAEAIAHMRKAGRITGEALALAGEAVRPGVTTKQLDDIVRGHIERCGAKPAFLGYGGFPASACVSVNDEVIHGIPSAKRVLQEGDIVKIDCGAIFHGYVGDSANTFAVGRVLPETQKLIDVTRESFYQGLAQIKIGNRIGDIGHAVQAHAEKNGFSVIRKYVGHGVGQNLHEAPDVPNYGTPGRGPRLCAGMVIAVEPMIAQGTHEVRELSDGWTVKTADGKLAAHYEHTIALTEEGVTLLTLVD